MTEPYVIYWKPKAGGKTQHDSPQRRPSLDSLDDYLRDLNNRYPDLVHWAYPQHIMEGEPCPDATP